MMLDDKVAIIYGAGGPIGGAIAKAFAAEGARVHLTGRTRATLEKVAAQIREQGGHAETAEVDAMDEAAVDAHAATVGTFDISVNVTATYDVQGTPMVEMSVDDYLAPVTLPVRSRFITSR